MQVNEQGTIQDTWSTLVDPEPATGPSHVHGIIAHHVRNVPRFMDILPHIQQQLAGRTVVGHNATFDLEFLRTEFQRAGVIIPSWLLVCTMQLAKSHYLGESASLTDTSQRLNIETGKEHTATVDTLAAAVVLSSYIGRDSKVTARRVQTIPVTADQPEPHR